MAGTVTKRQLEQKIKAADLKVEKYRGYIKKLQDEKKELNAQIRKLESARKTAAKKTTAKKTAAKKTTAKKTTAKKATARKSAKKPEPNFLEGVLEGVGIEPKDLLEAILGKGK